MSRVRSSGPDDPTTRGTAKRPVAESTNATRVPPRIVRVAEVVRRTGLSRTTLWRMQKRRQFPSRRELSPGTIGWLEGEIDAWIRERVPKVVTNPDDPTPQGTRS